MSFALLSTKLYIPPVRAGAVARPLLVERMLAGLRQPGCLLLLCGPAGFGKTSLLSQLAERLPRPPAWLALDEADSDPNRFWTYLIAACQPVLPGAGETALGLLRTAQPLPDEAIPTLLLNDLAAQNQPLVLMLDDFHNIQNPSIQAGLLFLIEHLPPNAGVALATRSDPPWPLARLRARNRLVEIRARDLRFDQVEAAAFLTGTMGLDLSAPAQTALAERTEGWIAGLQLAAISLQGRGDVEAFLRDFSGSHAFIADYLLDEVLKRQPPEMQDFLLQTSILTRLRADLCEAVTQQPGGQRTLDALQRANIFLLPLDGAGQWARYHHLFADLLRARLPGVMAKEAVQSLHRRAAAWYEENGMLAEAVEHARAAGDMARVVRLVEAAGLPMILQAHVRTVEGWLQAIPAEHFRASPRLNMAGAWMNLLRGTLAQAEPLIERLAQMFAAPGAEQLDAALHAEWLALQAERLISLGRAGESRALAVQAQRLLPGVAVEIRGMIAITLAKAYQQSFDFDRAAEVFEMIVADARRMGDLTFEILGASGQAQMVLKQGRLRQTVTIVSEAIRRLEESGKSVPFSATLYGELGLVYFYWCQFEQASAYLRRSMEISGKSGYSDPEIYYHIMLSKIHQMQGDAEAARQAMEQASQLARAIPPVMVREHVIAQQVRIHLESGQPGAAEALLAADGFSFTGGFAFPPVTPGARITEERGLLYNSALRVLLYRAGQQEPELLRRGIELAAGVLEGELLSQSLPEAIETLLLRSRLQAAAAGADASRAADADASRAADADASRADAARALALAAPEGILSVFVEGGPPVAAILAGLRGGDLPGTAEQKHRATILAAFPRSSAPVAEAAQAAAATAPASELVEPLSAREREVLGWIAAGDSNRAIAEKLVITVSAVKKHTGNIYGKLGVNSRTQAILRARQLGLLPADD